jgi:hypothetical protein
VAYRYKVVPFMGQSRGSLSAAEVADQLEHAIRRYASEGWEFYQLSDVNIEVQPGCLAGLFGAKIHYVRFDQLIFRLDESAEANHRSVETVRQSPERVQESAVKNDAVPDTPSPNLLPNSGHEKKPWLSPFCYHCGADIRAGSKTCSACGLAL